MTNNTNQVAAKDDHTRHAPPTHNSDCWIYCEPCGGWVIHRPAQIDRDDK